MTCRCGNSWKKNWPDHCCISDKLRIDVPSGYDNWGQAIEDIWAHIESDTEPRQAPKNVWAAFETYALKLVPKVTT